jgi:hypothetical protein
MRTGSFDLIWVLLLSVLCTNVPQYLSITVLKEISAFTVNMACNMEPVYGLLLGALVFHENKSLNNEFYIGAVIILGTVFGKGLVENCDCVSCRPSPEKDTARDPRKKRVHNITYERIATHDIGTEIEAEIEPDQPKHQTRAKAPSRLRRLPQG